MTKRERHAVNAEHDLKAASGRDYAADPDSFDDWATWLQQAAGTDTPRGQPPSASDIAATWTALTHIARRDGFTVERANCGGAEGFTTWRNRRIRIRPDAAAGQAVSALAHQLGHVLLHGQIAALEPSGTVPCTGIRKVEADSVAYLTLARTGISTEAITFPNVSSWAGIDPRARPAATVQAVIARILDAAAAITRQLESAGIATAQTNALAGVRHRGSERRPGPDAPADDLIRAHHAAARFFRNQMPGSWVPGYLARRGLSTAVQDDWLSGYAPAEWDALTRHLRDRGYSDTVIEASGLARRSRLGTLIDTFRDRATFPIRSADGTIIAFIGRAAEHADPRVPKYLNSPSTSLYNKSEVLFGLWEARDALARGARPVVAEGPLDAIAITTAGQGKLAGLAPCGTAFTSHHATTLSQTADVRVVGISVAFDPDNAGRRAAIHAYHLLVPLTDRLTAVTLPPGRDPAQILAEAGPAALVGMLTERLRPLPDLVINTEVANWARWLRYPEGQIGALRAAAPLIAAMPPAHVARQVGRLAAILRLDHATVTEAVTDALTELIADPATGNRPDRLARQATPGPAVVRTAGHDSPHQGRPAIGRTTAATPAPARNRRADAVPPRLTGRRIPR